jgi:tetratricopeptide (TPR) repeat protein
MALANASCSKKGPTKDEILSRAKEYGAAGQYAKAENGYREVLRLEPTNPVATRELALLYKDQGELPQAYTLLQKAAELQPDNAEIQVKLGQIKLVIGQFKDARNAALRALEKQPGGEEALILLAATAVRLNDVEETRQFIEGLRTKDQDRAGYHVALGLLALSQKDQGQAEAEFKAALKLDSKSAAAYTALGNLYWSRNDLGAADQAFKAAVDTEPQPGNNHLEYANFKLRTGAIAEAKKILEDINSKSPDYLPAIVALMQISCAEHNDNDCAARVQAVLTRDPANFDGLLQDGIRNIANGDAAKAVREFGYLSNLYTKNPQVRYQLGRAYLLLATKTTSPVESRNAVENADKALAEAVNLDPNLDAARLLLANIKIRKGIPAAAVDLLTPLVKERPQIPQAQYLLATAYLAQQKTNEALTIYRRMVELFPKDPQPSFIIGNILLAQRQQDEARKAFEKAVEIAPDYLPGKERLVDLDIAQQQYATALGRLQTENDKDPKTAPVFAMRGKIYLAQRDFAHAEADLSKALELNPNLEPAYLLLAQLYVASNKQDLAIAKLNAFVEKNDRDIPALMQLALLQERLTHFDAARDAYEKVLTVNPNLATALNNLAVIYSDNLGQIDKAYDLAKKARAAAPNEPHIADTLGRIAFKKGDYSEALSALQESASKLPDSPEIQYHLGMVYYMMGQEEPARIALKNAADASADFPGKDDARKRLSVLAIKSEDPAARTELQNYLNQQPDDPAALARLAALQQRDGAVEDAIKTYEKTLSADPAYAPATRALALRYARQSSNDPRAYDLTTKAREAYPDDPELTKALGILNYRRGSYPQSAELLKSAAAESKDDPELLYYLGQTQHQLKQWSDCKDTLQRAKSLGLSAKLTDEGKPALADCVVEDDRSKGIASYGSGDFAQSAKLLAEASVERKNDPELLYYLGQSYRQLKQPNECKDTLERALSLSLSPQLADQATRALADCSQTSAQ